jgi:hypothetical protein
MGTARPGFAEFHAALKLCTAVLTAVPVLATFAQ